MAKKSKNKKEKSTLGGNTQQPGVLGKSKQKPSVDETPIPPILELERIRRGDHCS